MDHEQDAEQLEGVRLDKVKLRRQVQKNDLREMLAIPAGVRFIKRIWNNSQVFNDAHTGNSTTFYNLGFKRFGLNLAADLRELWKEGSPEERASIAEIMIDTEENDALPNGERQ